MTLTEQLNQFTGSENFYREGPIIFTDGIKFLATQAKCFWLIDLIKSYQYKLKNQDFQLWELNVNLNNKTANIHCRDDTNSPNLVYQEIPYTDFPEPYIKLYVQNNTLMLPSEY